MRPSTHHDAGDATIPRSATPWRATGVRLTAALTAMLLIGGCAGPQRMRIAPEDVRLVNLRDVDPTFVIDARYATENNFVGARMYPSNDIFLEYGAAVRLKIVQASLRRQDLGLKVFDGYRPHAVQYRLWEIMPDPVYVARPEKGSRHNRGCAVDVTLVDAAGRELPMPTAFDEFNERAHHDYQDLPPGVLRNRATLKNAMGAAGFAPLASEWWHYDAPGWQRFPLLDVNPYDAPLFPDD